MTDEERRVLYRAIQTLPPKAGMVMRLRLAGHSYRQIGRMMGYDSDTGMPWNYIHRVAMPLLRKRIPHLREWLASEPHGAEGPAK